ncbi:NAD(P)H-dependent oxidoreductase [Teredinibacter sp. KSP-S5-2]|uniref:NAD(P)H-dependent oxidoreductase n=1 Tax=Teredinibacter sp. KSP-S5-2 TaxID=3034506 RepID=UPI00293477C4|nr:NAD(P)H-dependent oxidoreductase [Teredinibacter sp. KSP-S5-2]WNO10782.1 NAD(P)H-dependent oxidoreductase [Teredinibacter sp. KSP-S5-2]
MKCLVVIAHPQQNSLCSHLAKEIIQCLSNRGVDITEENLYQQNFDPVLSKTERDSYYADAYHYQAVESSINRLLAAEYLVLVFPTWWFGFPAILKGWFDRVWAPGFAYDHASDYGPITPKLNNLKKVLVVTTFGAPWWVDKLVLWQPVKRVVKYALLGACARKAKLTFLPLYKCESVDSGRVNKFVLKIKKVLNQW